MGLLVHFMRDAMRELTLSDALCEELGISATPVGMDATADPRASRTTASSLQISGVGMRRGATPRERCPARTTGTRVGSPTVSLDTFNFLDCTLY